ncbi:alpha-L-fucosidase [Persicirhabdus sediminis]|uniref:alpha-L-fucosidase n=1 Tax=Persicirhabdus sediminis TaxID=454144 RepID=A0A8J7SII1_9BACT|nr:alpha-L-fucosidase [Persicirhabdus sediminis]MBK1791475.1 alpha-L-fucosidase [Persicirhabdus sediminis]
MNKSTLLAVLVCGAASAHAESPYQANIDSLKKHKTPEWLLDAKFGIWTHWCPVTNAISNSAEQMGWYGGQMYIDGSREQQYHLANFGTVEDVGYGDLCEKFNPEKFDPASWAELFAKSGAKFAGPTAVHHDNFAMWDSEVTPWNAVAMGPKRDIVGELEKEIRAQGMKYMLSYHHGYSWFYYRDVYKHEQPSEKNILLFGESRPADIHEFQIAPVTYQDRWLGMANEANNKYQPDVIWHDFGLEKNISPDYRDKFLAEYFNMGERNGKQVEALIRDFDLPKTVCMNSMEKGVRGYLDPIPWNVVTSISQEWFAFSPKNGVELLSLGDIVHQLVDTVSKNGTFILNIGPNADGTIRQQYQDRLLELGGWLEENGDAIYNTRPWDVYGEFPRGIPRWRFVGHVTPSYDSRDIRYTRSKDGTNVYAITLGWPKMSQLELQAVKVNKAPAGAAVTLLGSAQPVAFSKSQAGNLVLDLSSVDLRKLDHSSPAYAFDLSGFDLAASDRAHDYSPNAIGLYPREAAYSGWGLHAAPEERGAVITRWVTENEQAHWQKNIREASRYKVVVRYSMRHEHGFPLQLVNGNQVLNFDVEHTGAGDIKEVTIGSMQLEQGFQEFVLRTKDKTRPTYKHLKIYGFTLVPE